MCGTIGLWCFSDALHINIIQTGSNIIILVDVLMPRLRWSK